MIEIQQLSRSYGDTHITYPDWQVPDQAHALILGTSGSGKTTLLHMLCGLLKPSTGDIVIHGQSVSAMSHAQLDKYRGANIGVVFQRPHLIKALTVIENIQLAVYLSGKKVAKEKYDYVLDSLDLGQLKNRKVHELSEGQAQRVSIARAVIHDPVLLVADEPTASLDDANCERVLYLLKAQAEACKANLIIATHDQRIKGAFDNQLVL